MTGATFPWHVWLILIPLVVSLILATYFAACTVVYCYLRWKHIAIAFDDVMRLMLRSNAKLHLCKCLIRAQGYELNVRYDQMIDHFDAGGRLSLIIETMIAGKEAGRELLWHDMVRLDKQRYDLGSLVDK